MTKTYFFFLPIFMLAWSVKSMADSQNRLFYDGVRAEASGDIDSAILYYEKSGKISHSSNLHGNLANLYFKKENFGKSILHYRKALLLDPQNRDLANNLDFAVEIAGVKTPATSNVSGLFSPSSVDFWMIFLAVIFWSGALGFSLLFFLQGNPTHLLIILFGCLTLGAVSGWALFKSKDNQDLLGREVIALAAEPNTDSNQSNLIYLRLLALEGSSANTSVVPGESLFLDLDERGDAKSHIGPKGKVWYLTRNLDRSKRGWIREDQIGRILENSPS